MDTLYAPLHDAFARTFPLHHAARRRDIHKLSTLISSGCDVNQHACSATTGLGGTPLWYAAAGPEPGGVSVAELLLRAGARPNDRCEQGRTPLHVAAISGRLDMVLYLMHHGADPTLTDEDGRTPSQFARERFEAVQQQAKAGSIDDQWRDWLTHVAAVIAILEVDRREITASGVR